MKMGYHVMSIWRFLAKISTLYILVILVVIYMTLLSLDDKVNSKREYAYVLKKPVQLSAKKLKTIDRYMKSWKKRERPILNESSVYAEQYYGKRNFKKKLLEKIKQMENYKNSFHSTKKKNTEIIANPPYRKNIKQINKRVNKNIQVVRISDISKTRHISDHEMRKNISELKKRIKQISSDLNFSIDSHIKKKAQAMRFLSKGIREYPPAMITTTPSHGHKSAKYRYAEYVDDDDDDNNSNRLPPHDEYESRWKEIVRTRLEYSYSLDNLQDVDKNKKLILLYTPLWNAYEWSDLFADRINTITREYRCPVNNCVYTYNKRLFTRSDAVVFHMPDQRDNRFLTMLNKYGNRSSAQRWVFFTSESPISTNTPELSDLDGLFNMTMTYDSRSDVYLPYGRYRTLNRTEKKPSKKRNYAKGRRNGAIWFVSNCDMRIRKWLAKQLGKYIDVHVGGNCVNEFENRAHCVKNDGLSNTNECQHVIQSYKYYLSFESRYCNDYVTEKYWDNAIANDVIPIVLGGADYTDSRIAIPGSYINAQDFKSIKELGEYLQMLNKNDKEYNKYFKWKQTYTRVDRDDWPYSSEWVCNLCAEVNKKDLKTKIYNLTNWWNKDKLCNGERNSIIRNMYENYWKEYQVLNNMSDVYLPLNDNGKPNYEALEDMVSDKRMSEQFDDTDVLFDDSDVNDDKSEYY